MPQHAASAPQRSAASERRVDREAQGRVRDEEAVRQFMHECSLEVLVLLEGIDPYTSCAPDSFALAACRCPHVACTQGFPTHSLLPNKTALCVLHLRVWQALCRRGIRTTFTRMRSSSTTTLHRV